MNPFTSESEIINIDGVTVKLPEMQEGQNDLSPSLIFKASKWVPDEESLLCTSCQVKFTQLRRKHHCRNCGKIYCAKCCSEKMFLPHLGINQLEKVCTSCKLIVDLLNKAKSDDTIMQQEAVIGLSNLVTNVAGLTKVIENGGIHIMFSLAIHGDTNLKRSIASAIHNIAQNMSLNSFLIEAGCLKVLKSNLATADDDHSLLTDSLSALQLLCHDGNVKIQVLKEGVIEPLLKLVNCHGIAAVLSARILLLLVNNFAHHEFIFQKHPGIISDLLKTLQGEDVQMQCAISKMFVFLTAGTEEFRNLLIQEDAAREFPLLYFLKGTSQVVLNNAVCIIANISLSMNQNPAHQYITGLCEVLDVAQEDTTDLVTHIGRGLANFAEQPENSLQLIHHLQSIVTTLLKSKNEVHKFHACRLIVKLFSIEPTFTLEVLSQNGLVEFVEVIFDLPGLPDTLSNLLLRKVSRLSVSQ